MPGRKRKPTHLHVLQGTRPHQSRSGEPQGRPLGDPPATLTPEALACWHNIVGALPPGVAQAQDAFVIEIAAYLLARLRSGEAMKSSEIGALHRCLASLGMTPTDRSKAGVPPVREAKPAGDPWDALQ